PPFTASFHSKRFSRDVASVSRWRDRFPWICDATILTPLMGLFPEDVGGSDLCCSGPYTVT
ncbi:hypothetical protein A2U01_0118447, partial [Trifolium medium]|nr:hypothetical protein [Trifolium medium]